MDTRISRRDLLRHLACAGLGGAMLPGLSRGLPARGPEGTSRPNMLFVLIDDLRWDAFSFMNHPFIQTPTLDRIRREGAHFANTFVTTSLCSPARAGFLTGTYAHTHGVTGNQGQEFDPQVTPSFPMLLRDSGYTTAYIGKWHMAPRATPRPGFDYWLSFAGQGVHFDPPLNENGRSFKAEGYMTDILTDYADTWLREKRDKNRPFCLYLAHKAVHGPFLPPERDKNLYDDASMPEPPNWGDTFAGKPRWQRAERVGQGKTRRSSNLAKEIPESIPPTPWDPRNSARMNQLRMVKAIDDGINRLLNTLEELGILDDTIIIFTSDNGYFHGEHRRGDKRLMYEESLRIPMLMRYPKAVQPGTTVEKMVLNIDIAPTLLDFAGLPAAPVMQGRSFRPLLASPMAPWRESFLYEYWLDLTPAIPDMVGIRTENWKLVRYPGIDDIDELYDLRNDPAEMVNLSRDPAYAVQYRQLQANLELLMHETGYRELKMSPVANSRELLLTYDFSAVNGNLVMDGSAHKHNGTLKGGRLVPGRNGQALELTGEDFIDVGHRETLDPSSTQWTVEAWVKPSGPDGIIIAQGGASLGYMLYLEAGKPAFAVRSGKNLIIADALSPCIGEWTHLAGVIGDRRISLFVNGKQVGTIALFQMINKLPNDGLQIGRDLHSPIDETNARHGFQGLIDSVSIFAGALTPEEIAQRASAS